MTTLSSYHLLIRSLAPTGPAPQLFAEAVRRTVCGFVGAWDYSRRVHLLQASAPSETMLATRLRTLLATDANPVPALLRTATTPVAFARRWNGLHRHWRVGIDTFVAPLGDDDLAVERRARGLPGQPAEDDSALKQRVIVQCLAAVRGGPAPTPTLGAIGRDLGLQHRAGGELATLLGAEPALSLADAAARLGCRPRTLERHLAEDGLRFAELRTATRLVEAGRLLRDTALPITEVALAAGFYDAAHFARGFRQATALTAGQYRAIAREAAA